MRRTLLSKNMKRILALFAMIVAFIILWLLPVQAENVSVKVYFEDVADGEHIHWTFISEKAYEKEYSVDTVVCDNQIEFQLNPEFFDLDEMTYVGNISAEDIESVEILAGEYSEEDWVIGQNVSDNLFVGDDEGSATEQFIDWVESTINNAWYIKLFVMLIAAIVALIFAMYRYVSKKYSKGKALGVCALTTAYVLGVLLTVIKYENPILRVENKVNDIGVEISGAESGVQQSFVVSSKRMKSVEVFIGKDEPAEGDVVVEIIREDTGEALKREIIHGDAIFGGAAYEIAMDDLINDPGCVFIVRLKPVNWNGQGSFYTVMSSGDAYVQGVAMRDQVQLEGDLCFCINYVRFFSVGLVIALLSVFWLILLTSILVTKEHKNVKVVIIAIYLMFLGISILKMVYYAHYVGNTPDERNHVGYVAYLELENKVIPDFSTMNSVTIIQQNEKEWKLSVNEEGINYLGHPPLYYNILRLANAVDLCEDGTVNVEIQKLRFFSMGLAVIALMLMFYIGYSRIEKEPYIHVLYASICTSVPMLLYGAAGVSNDTLLMLTFTIYLLGTMRFVKEKRNFLTYILIAIGITGTIMTKLTAGCIVAFASVIIIAYTFIKEKSYKKIINKYFWITAPLYVVTALYYIYIYSAYGTFQPGVFELDLEYARNSGFYVAFESRQYMNILDYTVYFFESFRRSWTGISSHIALLKESPIVLSVQTIALELLWVLPLLSCVKFIREKNKYGIVLLAGYFGTVMTVLLQYKMVYDSWLVRGYLGGFQSRYYACAIAVFAFAIAYMVQIVQNSIKNQADYGAIIKGAIKSVAIIFTILLLYEDFIFFLLHFKQYIFYG